MAIKSLYALSHGKKAVNPANHLYGIPVFPKGLETQFFFWCIIDDEQGAILVDQGCTADCLTAMGIPSCLTSQPPELLKSIGVSPQDVRHVILSHLHWDHFAGEEFFPEARYYLHEKEFRHVNGPLMGYKIYSQHYYPLAIKRAGELLTNGRLALLEGETGSVMDGIDYIRTGGHTPGLISISVEHDGGKMVICGDVVPRYMNFAENIPCGIHYDVTEALQALEKIGAIAGDQNNVLPGHDTLIAEKYDAIKPGVYKIF